MSKELAATHRPAEEDAQLLTTDDLAKQWQMSAGTIANWRLTAGKGPAFIRIGGFVRYHPKAVQDWLEAQPTK